ncbi:tyrosine-type recombinase/integrase [Paenibacillus xerothermodurans]|uniref:Integrase n=1 Tax=Paenibacillus xerothermodurans TaxID=1977292 RepID=A0A2W1NXG1_PAEXE|nr:tyrosine-type recombinase/integrase [Paenibacillus xerothermodurans]PZE20302.1 integrase [Paenibacillus xerothermodurans]
MLKQFIAEGLLGKSELTVKTYNHALEQFAIWLDGSGANLENFSRSDVQQYVTYMVSKKKTAATINKVFNAIKKYCKWAKKSDCIEDIYIIKPTEYKQTAPKALDRIERNQLVRNIDRSGNKRNYAITLTLLYTGLRVSELVALDRSDVEISDRKGILKVRTGKGNKERVLPLEVEVRRAIEKYLEERSDNQEALFISNRGKRISIRSIQHLLEQHDIHAHQLRHTFITGLVRANQDISVIQSLSGHSSADMILRYSKPTEDDKIRAVEGLYKD